MAAGLTDGQSVELAAKRSGSSFPSRSLILSNISTDVCRLHSNGIPVHVVHHLAARQRLQLHWQRAISALARAAALPYQLECPQLCRSSETCLRLAFPSVHWRVGTGGNQGGASPVS